MKNLEIKNKLYENGYVVIRNLLNNQEVEDYSKLIRKICENENSPRVDDLYNHEETWQYIVNKKLISNLENYIDEKIYYMNDSGISSYESNYAGVNKNLVSWHRDTDSAPQIEGHVPYYKKDKYYKVFTTITYFSNNTNGILLNVIPGSHEKKFRYTFRNFLRLFHWRTKNKKIFFLLRNLIEKIIGTNCQLNSGDCFIFFSTFFHKPVASKGIRQAILSRYAPKSENSENYVNYVLKQSSNKSRSGYLIKDNSKIKIEKFINLLKNNNIFYPTLKD